MPSALTELICGLAASIRPIRKALCQAGSTKINILRLSRHPAAAPTLIEHLDAGVEQIKLRGAGADGSAPAETARAAAIILKAEADASVAAADVDGALRRSNG